MYLGNPSRDIILWRDEQHYAAMERGSVRLRHAIEDYHLARMRRTALQTWVRR
jgi:hypothetical protein